MDRKQPPSRPDSGEALPVTLTTLHSSKGLEYDVVFMADLTNREIPGEKALAKLRLENDASLIEEERRLFYVGMTRARTSLYMISPESVNGRKESRSVFVNELAAIMNREMNGRIAEGIRIHHKKYGDGVIACVDVQPDRTLLEVDFKGVTRTFDLAVCMENGIITLI